MYVRTGGRWTGGRVAYLEEVAERAAAEAAALDRAAIGDLRIGTDGMTARQVTEAIIDAMRRS